MGKVYITGHRNPDLDSLCSALAYAGLKNQTDPDNQYVAVHCSPVSAGVRKQMETMGLKIPAYMKDVRPKVRDVMITSGDRYQADDPMYDLIQTYSTDKPPVVPVFDGEDFRGLLSVDDITGWFLQDNKEEIPVYSFTVDNLLRVISGTVLHKGASDEITGSMLVGVAADDAFRGYLDTHKDSIVVLGSRSELIAYSVSKQVPAIILTAGGTAGDIDLGGYKGTIISTDLGTAETVRKARMAESIGSMMETETETVDADELFVDVRKKLARTRNRGLAVTKKGKFVGYVSRRCFLETPQYNVIMVDHNEPAQSIEGIETANVIEIIDHHRLDAVTTRMPIFIDAEPLGSACTIVYQQYIRHGIMPDQQVARVLLTGIISDTLILRSPTTTASDISTAEMLARIAKVPSIGGFGERLFSVTDNLAAQDPEESILADFKKYESGGVKLGIGQCEVTTLGNYGDYAAGYLDALETVRSREGLDWTLLMITDVLKEQSLLLVSDYKANADLPYGMKAKQIYSMPGVMSRKKQLLPTLLSITGR